MAIRTRWPTSPMSGRLPATPPHAIRTGSWLAPEAPTDLRFRRRFVAGLCVTVGALSLLPLAELAARTYRSRHAAPPHAPVIAAPPPPPPSPSCPGQRAPHDSLPATRAAARHQRQPVSADRLVRHSRLERR